VVAQNNKLKVLFGHGICVEMFWSVNLLMNWSAKGRNEGCLVLGERELKRKKSPNYND
jgi:hypothetical protein